jgi:hypothetical protein
MDDAQVPAPSEYIVTALEHADQQVHQMASAGTLTTLALWNQIVQVQSSVAESMDLGFQDVWDEMPDEDVRDFEPFLQNSISAEQTMHLVGLINVLQRTIVAAREPQGNPAQLGVVPPHDLTTTMAEAIELLARQAIEHIQGLAPLLQLEAEDLSATERAAQRWTTQVTADAPPPRSPRVVSRPEPPEELEGAPVPQPAAAAQSGEETVKGPEEEAPPKPTLKAAAKAPAKRKSRAKKTSSRKATK